VACLAEGLSATTFEGKVAFIIPPPINQDRILILHRHLKSYNQIQDVDIKVSEDKGIAFTLILRKPTPILQILAEIQNLDIRWEFLENAAIQEAESASTTMKLVLTDKK